jgi:LacI family transcriptional regulator
MRPDVKRQPLPELRMSEEGRPPARFATIHDVARETGFSVGTISKALNNNGQLKAETRERVRQAAERLHFRPNNLARSLHSRRSFVVGLLSNDSYGRFSIPILEGLERALSEKRVSVIVCNSGDDRDSEQCHLETLVSKRVDGVIFTARRIDRRFSLGVEKFGLPTVYVYATSDDPNALCLLPDEHQGGKAATRHLISLGRQRIAHVTGPESFAAVQARLEGYRDTVEEHGQRPCVLHGDWSEAWGYEAFSKLSLLKEAPDAIFCGSDQIARGIVDAVRESGRSVPTDVSVVGFDNWTVMAEAARPALTTVDPDLRALGEAAGRALLDRIDNPNPEAGVRRLPCRLVVRQSCGTHIRGNDTP